MDRLDVLDERLVAELASLSADRPPSVELHPLARAMSRAEAQALADAALRSRALDRAARRLRAAGTGYYTIASAGHERNALLGLALETGDPCLLHYRSGALFLARAAKAGMASATRDVLLSFRAAAAEPIAGGRHKVWGSRALAILPQTSTIASQLPKAVGLAFALSRARRLGLATPFADDAIVVCSFGDASANHASALAGVRAARYAHRRGHAVPILLVCEDNGLGISERTPTGWLAQDFGAQSDLVYVRAAGALDEAWAATRRAVAHCRATRSPVLLHLDTVRLGGHAGGDAESAYLRASEIAAMEARDPLLELVRVLVIAGLARADELVALHARIEAEVAALADEVAAEPPLGDAARIVAPLPPAETACGPGRPIVRTRRVPAAAEDSAPATLAALLTRTLGEILADEPAAVVFGEDVGRKGGVYGVTAGLQRRFGPARVFDTMLDETSILGTAQGLALAGLLPIAEIQYLAYLHNAIDQLRGEACSQSFFSAGAFRNPLLVRIASFAYQKGFGGHFHNDHAVAALREIPGLLVAAPAFGDDAARMLRAALRLAREDGRVVAFLEPIALYFERDLHAAGDGLWLRPPPAEDSLDLPPGSCGVYGADEPELVLVSYANGLRLALRAAANGLAGVRVRVLDLRWLAPLPLDDLARRIPDGVACLVVDECRRSGGVADAIVASLAERGHRGALGSVRSLDSYVPLGPAARHVLLGEEAIVEAARALLSRG